MAELPDDAAGGGGLIGAVARVLFDLFGGPTPEPAAFHRIRAREVLAVAEPLIAARVRAEAVADERQRIAEDGATYYTPEQNATRRPFVINKRCPIHGEASPVPAAVQPVVELACDLCRRVPPGHERGCLRGVSEEPTEQPRNPDLSANGTFGQCYELCEPDEPCWMAGGCVAPAHPARSVPTGQEASE